MQHNHGVFLPSSLKEEGLSDQEIVRIVANEAIRNVDIADTRTIKSAIQSCISIGKNK